jgi:AcrR family transcriptional regulator
MGAKPALPRRLGRPDAQASAALDHLILATASRLFTEQGYAATSVEQIAVAAKVGKQTIYRRYATKELLFNAVISELSGVLFNPSAFAVTPSTDPLAALREACQALVDLASKPDAVAIYRVLIAESRRFPGLTEHALNGVSGPFNTIVIHLIGAARQAGQIHCGCDDATLSRVLLGILTGWSLHQALLDQKDVADEAERAAFFASAWSVFLEGALARPRYPQDALKQ